MAADMNTTNTTTASSDTNRQILLQQRPQGVPGDECWTLVTSNIPEPADGEFVVQNHFISLDPAMRGWMNDSKSYLPPVGIGEVMRAGSVGEVVASKHDKYPVGSHVVGVFGVQDYAISDGRGATPVDPNLAPLPMYLGALGMPGMTAYFGLLEVGKATSGDTVLISAAAGAVGQVAGQLAKIKGCRVVGLAGGEKKCRYVVDELGFDACIDYKQADVLQGIREHCPKGIDVYFDNVGGDILDAALANLAMHARVVICGAISQYNSDRNSLQGPKNYMSLLVNRATMQGFVCFDYTKQYQQAAMEIGGYLAQGKMQYQLDIVDGIEQFPATLPKLFTGENFGKLVIKA